MLTCSHGATCRTEALFASIIRWLSTTHSLQIYTPGPATSLSTTVFGFPQNEHEAIRDLRMVTGHLPIPGLSDCSSRLSVVNLRRQFQTDNLGG